MFLIGDRLTQNGFGSVNNFNHGGVCGMTGVMANVRTHPTTKHKRMYADIDHCECLIIWGHRAHDGEQGAVMAGSAPVGGARARHEALRGGPAPGAQRVEGRRVAAVMPGKDAELAFA